MKVWEKIMLYPIGLCYWIADSAKKTGNFIGRKAKPAVAMLLAVTMLLSLMPITAFAVSSDIIVGGANLGTGSTTVYYKNGDTSGNLTGTPEDYNAKLEIVDGVATLTIKNLSVTGTATSNYAGIFSTVDLNIVLEGGNSVTGGTPGTDNVIIIAGICAENKDLTITGSGTLSATGGTATGISGSFGILCDNLTLADDDIVINAAGGTATGGESSGIFANTVEISGGTVNATGGTAGTSNNSIGIDCGGTLSIGGNATVNATGGSAGTSTYSIGISCDGTLSIEGNAIVNATGGSAGITCGIYSNDVKVAGGVTVATGGTASGTSSGIYHYLSANVTTTGGILVARSGSGTTAKAINGTLDTTGTQIADGAADSTAVVIVPSDFADGSDLFTSSTTVTLDKNYYIVNNNANAVSLDSSATVNTNGHTLLAVSLYNGTELTSGINCTNPSSSTVNTGTSNLTLGISGSGKVIAVGGKTKTSGTGYPSCGIKANLNLNLNDDYEASVIAIGGPAKSLSYGLYGTGTVNGSLTAIGGPVASGNSCGINTESDSLNSAGTITAIGGVTASTNSFYGSSGIQAKINITDGTVNAVGSADTGSGYSCGIRYNSASGTAISGGTVNAVGGPAKTSYGFDAWGPSISGGTLNAVGGASTDKSYGFGASSATGTINGSAVINAVGGAATTNSYGIKGQTTFSGGTVTATGGSATMSCGIYNDKEYYYPTIVNNTAAVTATGGTYGLAAKGASLAGGSYTGGKEAVYCQNGVNALLVSGYGYFAGETQLIPADSDSTVGSAYQTVTVKTPPHTHSYTYAVNGENAAQVIESCTCGHMATATLTATDATYTGSAITTGASVTYSDGWAGSQEHGEITYSNNPNAGTATAKVKVEDKELTTTFEINEADISGAAVTLNPTSGTYTGTAYNPSVSVTLDGLGTLVEGTDYTLSWNKTGFTNADTYTVTVTGEGNFEGMTERTFTINAADLANVKVEQDGTLTYNGAALTPTVSASAVAVNNQPITFTYSTLQDGNYGSLPSFTEAGTYTVYYKATAPNHNNATGSFTVTVDKVIVTEPTIASKPYNGSVQTADIADTEFYTVEQNNGGTEKGSYNVVLKLKDADNYKWATTDNAEVTAQFVISAAENSWTTDPSISGWTYGEAAKAPVGEAKFGEVSVEYSGTTNGGAAYNGVAAPTEAGSYTATFTVAGTENYSGLSESVNFTIAKATYDMSSAKWDYTNAFKYDGKEHKVEVLGLPAGVTVGGYNGNTATVVGDYTAKVTLTYDANNYNAPSVADLSWKIENNWTPSEFAVNGSGWMNQDFVITANDDYKVSLTNTADGEWKNALTYSAETNNGSVTFYLMNETDGTISLAKTVTYMLDKTAPTGKVEFVDRTGWQEFVNTITFGLFYKDEVIVKITSDDNLSGVAMVEYYASDDALTLNEVKAIANWSAYSDSFGVSVEDTKKFVYYVRITDNAGNVTYLSTDGAEYDITVPVISGIENGKTYYTTQKVTVTDKNLDTVTLNGNEVTGTVTLTGDKDVTYTIVAADKAGNSTTVSVTMKPIRDLAKATENLSNDNVTSDDEQALKDLVAKLDELLADEDVSNNGERETLEQYKSIAEGLLVTIDEATKATNTENTVKVEDVTSENVTPDDKTDLEKAKDDLEKALEEYGDNYTEDEKKAIEDEIKRIDDALEVIGNVEAVEELIDKLPENITKNDEAAIKEADDAYNALTDYEKSLVDKDAKKALDDAKAALAELNKPAAPNSPNTGDTSNMFLWIALLFISGGAVITLTVVDRKKRMARHFSKKER